LLSNLLSAIKSDEKTKTEQEIKGSRTGWTHEIPGRCMNKTCIKMESYSGKSIDLLQIHQPNTESYCPQLLGNTDPKKQKKGTHPNKLKSCAATED
jgi:hypothetical protein